MTTPTTRRASYTEYLDYVDYLSERNPAWRSGQTHFNALRRMRPDLANEVLGTAIDPFHLDERLPDFVAYVQENW